MFNLGKDLKRFWALISYKPIPDKDIRLTTMDSLELIMTVIKMLATNINLQEIVETLNDLMSQILIT